MNAILKVPGKAAEEIQVHDDGDRLKTVQGIIGGYLEEVSLYGNVVAICDEDGIAKKLPGNCGLLGPILFLGIEETDDGMTDWTGLTDEQKRSVYRWIKGNE
jgi:Domain of unknown function (DUF3846)